MNIIKNLEANYNDKRKELIAQLNNDKKFKEQFSGK